MTKIIDGKKRTYSHKITIIALIISLLLIGVVSADAPEQVTGLANASSCKDVVWSWTNPVSADFNGTTIWRNGVFVENLTNATEYTSWTGLTPGGTYTLNITTFNLTGVMNATNATQTTVLPACPNPVTCTSSGIVGALTLIGVMLMGAGAVMIIVPFSTLGGGVGRGGKTMGGMTGFTMAGIIAICIGAVLLLISYAILSPIFTLAGC